MCHDKDLMQPNKQANTFQKNKRKENKNVSPAVGFEEFFRNSSAFTEGNCYIEGWPLSPSFQACCQFAQKLSSCSR